MTDLTLFDLEIAKPLERFHNTTALKGDELKKCKLRTGTQNEGILKFFRKYPGYMNWTPFEVWQKMMLPMTPVTSIRRALTDLTKLEYLVKLDGKEGRPFVQRPGQYNSPTFAWKLK